MSETIGQYWYSEFDTDKISVVDEGILKDITKLYSKDYGNWIDSGNSIKLTPKRFLSLHLHEIIYFVADKSGNILGFYSVSTRPNKIKIITSMCVKKEYRNQGIGTSLLSYMLKSIHEDGWKVGVVSANPISLLILETYPGLKYIDLEEYVVKDISFGIQLSIFIDEFRRKSYNSLKKTYTRIEKISYKKINTGFEVEIPEEELFDNLGTFYRNLMGTLNPGEEWILFCNYEFSNNNTI